MHKIYSNDNKEAEATSTYKKVSFHTHKHRHKILKLVLLIIVILFLCLLTAYGTYIWQHRKVATLNTQTDGLQREIIELQKQVYNLKSNSAPASTSQSQTLTSTTATQSSALSSCQTSNLSLSLANPVGTAGTSYVDLIITNTSATSCTLNGYPTVTLLDGQGHQLGQAATPSSSATTTTITLQPNKAAYSSVSFPNPGFFSPGTCSADSADIRMIPPGSATALEANTTEQYCPGFSVSSIQTGS